MCLGLLSRVVPIASPPTPTVLAQADGPLSLSNQPLRFSLRSDRMAVVSLGAILGGLRSGERLFLLLHDVSLDPRPSATWQLFMDLPEGDIPDPTSLHFVGLIDAGGALCRYEITGTARALEPFEMRGESTAITIVPIDRAGASPRGTIARVEIVKE